MNLINNIRENARRHYKKIVLPEGEEERTLKAADILVREKLANIILLGDPGRILQKASDMGLESIRKDLIIDPAKSPKKDQYVRMMVDIRKSKGLTEAEASKLIEDPLYLGVMMIKNGDADGEVAGAMNATGDVLRPAFQYVKTKPGISIVSGAFIMILKDREFGEEGMVVFADCAVNPDPDARELAQIAISSAQTARDIAGFEPRIAMLSFSTKGSANHERNDKVIEATRLARQMAPDLNIDGELQADAAIIESIGQRKAPGSGIAGRANVLIFPSLEAGNIAYKLVERLGHAVALGPILQGMAAPINDMSRGCSVDDLVNMVAVTANQAAGSL
jgi:phosphate acetyltransferase